MNIRRHLLAVGAVLAAAATTATAQDAQPIVIKFSHVVASDAPKGKGALKFKELVEARTKGRVKVEVFPNSSLYKDKEELEALQLGAVQMLAPSVSKFGPIGAREFDVFELPYMFETYSDLHRITEGPVGRGLLKRLEPKGIVGLGYWDNGFKDISANRPLQNPADCRGLKMRIPSSKVLDSSIRALNAIPQVMAFSEVYQALQTGVVDGTENTPSNFYTQKMHEVQKFLTLTDHNVTLYVVVVNKKFWDRLPADVRTTLELALVDTTRYVNDIARQENDAALEAVRKSGRTRVFTLTADAKRAWKKAMLRVHQEHEEKIGRELMGTIYRETGFDPSRL